jgi:hypothetical protein
MASTKAIKHIQCNLEMYFSAAAKNIPVFHCIPQTVTATLQSYKITIKIQWVCSKSHSHKMSDIFAKA